MGYGTSLPDHKHCFTQNRVFTCQVDGLSLFLEVSLGSTNAFFFLGGWRCIYEVPEHKIFIVGGK